MSGTAVIPAGPLRKRPAPDIASATLFRWRDAVINQPRKGEGARNQPEAPNSIGEVALHLNFRVYCVLL